MRMAGGLCEPAWARCRRGSRDDGRLRAAGVLAQLAHLHRDRGERLDHVERVLVEIARRRLVLLEVEAHGRAVDAGATQPEDDTRAVRHHVPDALVRAHRAVDWVVVRELVELAEHVAALILSAGLAGLARHLLHHLGGRRLVHALKVVPRVVVAPKLRPVRAHNLADADEWLGGVGVLLRQNLQPRKHRPHAVLLPHVVRARAEGLLTAEEGRVRLALWERRGARVHQVAEELPAGGHLERLDAACARDAVERA
mmetsp:Transcript_18975/g.48920  ORF Transcript_18975/g.48920 Transcript_18975/m.48920 type:complete len:255 (+) Transcript_18975:223-987(+)